MSMEIPRKSPMTTSSYSSIVTLPRSSYRRLRKQFAECSHFVILTQNEAEAPFSPDHLKRLRALSLGIDLPHTRRIEPAWSSCEQDSSAAFWLRNDKN